MLWYDNDQKTDFQAKIERAARYYRDKYGQTPNLCFVHPGMLPTRQPQEASYDPVLQATGIEVRASNTMLPHHFWLGINGASGPTIPETAPISPEN